MLQCLRLYVVSLSGIFFWLIFYGSMFFSAFFTTAAANATPTVSIVVNQLDKSIDLSQAVEYLEDPGRNLTYSQVTASGLAHGLDWRRVESAFFVSKNLHSRYWFRVSFTIGSDISTFEPILFIPAAPSSLLELTLWLPSAKTPDNNDQLRQFDVGNYQPFSNRDIDSLPYAFVMPSTPQRVTLIGWIDQRLGATPGLLPLSLISKKDFMQYTAFEDDLLIAFYAIMGALFVYNACLFFTLRQKLYAFYVIFLFSAILSCSLLDGTVKRWLWPNKSAIDVFLLNCNTIVLCTTYAIFVWFSLTELHSVKRLRFLYRTILVLAAIAFLDVVYSPFGFFANSLAQAFSGLSMTFTLSMILYALKQKIPTAYYLLIAESCIIFGGVVSLFMIHGYLPLNVWTTKPLQFGTLGEAILLSLTLAAITRQVQEQAIRHLHQYRSLYEHSLEGLFEYNLKTGQMHANQSFARLFGYPSIDDMPKVIDPLEYFSPEDKEKFPALLLAEGQLTDYETQIMAPRLGEAIWISASFKMLKDDKGKPYRIDGSFRDISERKQKESAERQRHEIELASKAKSQFFASMSHEFRTPLTAILGYSETGLGADISAIEKDQHLETINKAGKHLLQLINDILDLSKIEAQKLEIEVINVDLIDLLQEIEDAFSMLCQKKVSENKEVYFRLNYVLPLPKIIQTDPTRLKQVLINICGNALKFTEQGGVTVHVSCGKSCDQNQNKLIFAVEDTGIGLKPEQLDKLFKAFTQADSSTTRNFGGTGLGLHLSKQITEKLGGDIVVTSEYGKGSVFTISIFTPLDAVITESTLAGTTTSRSTIEWLDAIPVRKTRRAHAITPPKVQGRVLYAEDNQENQKLVKKLLSQTGAKLDVASNGQQALDLINSTDYQLVFTDIRMPVIDGLALLQTLKATHPTLPIIAITATMTHDEQNEFELAGFNAILRKPLDTQAIYTALQKYLLPAKSEPGNNGSLDVHVLVADDNPVNQQLIVKHIQKTGAQVTLANDGLEAIAKALTQEFQLILMDLQMPVLDGLSAVALLRGKNYSVPIYALSADSSAETIAACDAAGCNGYLTKPYDAERIRELIKSL